MVIYMDNRLVEKYIPVVERLANKYQYPSNITHLLYLIVPAFVTKYQKQSEQFIISVFENVPIMISSKKSDTIQAYYTSVPKYIEGKVMTNKYIVIQNYDNISLVQLLDNLVHEFNHAVHSFRKEILVKDDVLYLRTGLTYASYRLPEMVPIEKDNSYILEEILNTNQTEDIICLIKGYHDLDRVELNNTIYAINQETNELYRSHSYYLENLVFRSILENKTFLSTLNNLRITGDVLDIEGWFDQITNQKGSYQKLNEKLFQIMELEKKLPEVKFFKKRILRKIRSYVESILEILEIFNQNCL